MGFDVRVLSFTLACLIGGIGLGRAVAEEPAKTGAAPPPAWFKACEADALKHCVEANKAGKLADCLASHEDKLSEDCTKAFLYRYKVAQMCKDDIEKHCKAESQSGGLGKCFQAKQDKLSQGCRSALVKGSKKAKAEEKTATAAAPKAEEKPAEAKPEEGSAQPASKTTKKKKKK